MDADYSDEELLIQLNTLTRTGVFTALHVEPRDGHIIRDMFHFMSERFGQLGNILRYRFNIILPIRNSHCWDTLNVWFFLLLFLLQRHRCC